MYLNKLKLITLPVVIVSIILFWWCWQQPVSTIYVVRHAEKGTIPPEDPPLIEAGHLRAAALSHLLQEAGVQVVIASQYQRTQQTVQPTATDLGLVVNIVDAGSTSDIVQLATSPAGTVTLISGHSNTLPAIIELLGGGQISEIPEDQFDNLFVVSKQKWHSTRVQHLKYGLAN